MAGGGIKVNNITLNGGADGATFVQSVDNDGYLSWSNNKGYPNPATVKIRGTTVVANPTESSTTNLTKLKVDNTVYNVPQGGGGTTVVANPTLTGSETDLTALQVGDTKYKVPQSRNYERMKLVLSQSGGVVNITNINNKYEVIFGANTWFIYGDTFYEMTTATTVTLGALRNSLTDFKKKVEVI